MQTGSSGTLIGWKSGQTTFVPLWDWMEGAWLRTQGWETLTPNLDKIILPRSQKILVCASKIYFDSDTKKWMKNIKFEDFFGYFNSI
jgi:hypothetical protein